LESTKTRPGSSVIIYPPSTFKEKEAVKNRQDYVSMEFKGVLH
jgi:hypothetical protein